MRERTRTEGFTGDPRRAPEHFVERRKRASMTYESIIRKR
jgi:hypothetical protein